jgi:hypothetical protein
MILLPYAPLPTRISLEPVTRNWLNEAAVTYHYMHRPIHARACPFGWKVVFDGHDADPLGKPYGFIAFCSVHFTKLKGEFGYPGLPTRWQVLSLARLWCHPALPKLSETCVIGKAHKLVQRRWLEVHPPRYLDQPYHIEKILSFSDNTLFQGTIYKAANYRLAGETTSSRRHKNTQGSGMDGHKLTRWIYDLPKLRHWWEDEAIA